MTLDLQVVWRRFLPAYAIVFGAYFAAAFVFFKCNNPLKLLIVKCNTIPNCAAAFPLCLMQMCTCIYAPLCLMRTHTHARMLHANTHTHTHIHLLMLHAGMSFTTPLAG